MAKGARRLRRFTIHLPNTGQKSTGSPTLKRAEARAPVFMRWLLTPLTFPFLILILILIPSTGHNPVRMWIRQDNTERRDEINQKGRVVAALADCLLFLPDLDSEPKEPPRA